MADNMTSVPQTPLDYVDTGSTTPPPLSLHPPGLARMATVGNVPSTTTDIPFDIVQSYYGLLIEDPELTMPVAAIEALIHLLQQSNTTTVFETLDLLRAQSDYLKTRVPNSISLRAGTDLFQRYIITSLKQAGEGDFEKLRQHLLSSGRTFANRAKAGRIRAAEFGREMIRDGNVILTHGGSRVVSQLLTMAAETNKVSGTVRFKVIYVLNSARASESATMVQRLRAKGVPVATISEGAVAYAMGKVDKVMVGAEGVVENGGCISRMGTYQIAVLAKERNRPFYVVAETHKFVRLFPLTQYDLPIDQSKVIDFKTKDDGALDGLAAPEERTEYFSPTAGKQTPLEQKMLGPDTVDAVDYTPPNLISALITDFGVKTTSAVSEELINIYY